MYSLFHGDMQELIASSFRIWRIGFNYPQYFHHELGLVLYFSSNVIHWHYPLNFLLSPSH